jgi:TonB family protein
MNFFAIRLLAITALSFAAATCPRAQSGTSVESEGNVSLTKLFQPVYSPLAKQTRITGDVVLTVEVRKDGNVESTSLVSGHPLLKQAALESAQHSQFMCKNCSEGAHSFQMVYSFQLGPTRYCAQGPATPKAGEEEEAYPRVIESTNHITVIDYPVGTCDMAGTITKARSLKCLYLWRCATH